MSDNTPNQPSKLRTKIELKKKDTRGAYNTNSQIKFKMSKLKSSLWDYKDTFILASETITITGEGDNNDAKRADERNKGVIFKNCAPFTDSMNKINR